MATTISTGTNPYKLGSPPDFGTLYSGRALEFDGVTDYFGFTKIENLTEATVAFWLKTTKNGGGLIYNTGNAAALTHVRYSSGKISVINGTNPTGDIRIDGGNWRRVIILFKQNGSGADYSLYIDGVEDTAGTFPATGVGSYNDVDFERFGQSTFPFDGSMTDCQIWDKNWSLSDVQYDYTHPEKLITHNSAVTSGTTISNLKLWYPMTEGNPRSPQTTVYDGSPKELGSEVLANGGFDEDESWSKYGSATISGGAAYLPETTSGYIVQVVLTIGKVYYYTLSAKSASDGNLNLSDGATTHRNIEDVPTTYTTYSGYFTAAGTSFVLSESSSGNIYIDSVSVKLVKMGNHGTTKFYGDELNTQANASSPTNEADAFIGWGEAGSGALTSDTKEDEPSGNHSLHFVASANGDWIRLDNPITVVVGMTYQVQVQYIVPNGDSDTKFKIGAGTAQGYTQYFLSGALNDTSWTTYTNTFVATTVNFHMFFSEEGNSPFDLNLYIDTISLKEIGVAAGWTTADAEPLIPQTALMGMSKPILFDGIDDYVTVPGGFNGLGSSATAFTVSFWVNADRYTNDGFIHVGSTGGNGKFHLKYNGNVMYVRLTGAVPVEVGNTTVVKGAWKHIVIVYAGGSYCDAYVNASRGINATSSIPANVDFSGTNGNLYIGFYWSSSYVMKGLINEVSVWSTAFSLAQVQELFNDGVPLDATAHSVHTSASTNLKGYWRNDGVSSWSDRSTNSNNGTPAGSPDTILLPEGTTSGKDILGFPLTHTNNGWLNLDPEQVNDSDDTTPYVNIPVPISSSLDLTQLFTIEAWVKIDKSGETNFPIGNWVGSDRGWYFSITSHSSPRLQLDWTTDGFWGTSVFKRIETGDISLVGNWKHIICIYNMGVVSFYIDTVAQSVETPDEYDGQTIFSARNITIGRGYAYHNGFKGQIDEVKIYNRALEQEEITKNYKHGKSKHKN